MAFDIGRAGILLGALALQCSLVIAAQPRFAFDTAPGVLPKDVVPSRYALTFDVDPARDEFAGRASITLRVRKTVPAIVLHAHELRASSATLAGAGGSRTLSIMADADTQTWHLAPDDAAAIGEGDYTLDIAYTGVVHVSGQGLYRAEYTVQGQPARMLATQLEARFARTLFPGFDEPAYRAVFDIAVRAPREYDVISNMPRSSKAAEGGAELHRFQPTPAMTPYLVAIAVGKLDALPGEAAGIPLRILSAEGKAEQGRYAMDLTKKILPYYTDYFGQPYALPKLDQLAVPSTRWGAMEDWGLISYAESLLLFDPAKSGPNTQRDVFTVVAHEVAHQWFGNLVTAASWEEIWLNEAFATWLARKATAKFNPAWQVDLHQRSNIDRAMRRDASGATRAIRSGPVTESAVFDVFDDITYTKGGAVLGMLEAWIQPGMFRRGLAAYIKGQQYSSATAGDLWHHMSAASGQDVSAVAASWTDQPGFPLLQVRAQCRQGATHVTLTQRRFSLFDATASSQVWMTPVRLSRGNEVTSLLLDAPQKSFVLDGCGDDPVLANAGGTGFYRVEYAPALLRALTARFTHLAPTDRVTLLSDTFALAQAGRVPLASYFALLARIPGVHDVDRAVLYSMANDGLGFLDASMAGTSAQRQVRAAGRRLFAPELSRLGWTPKERDDAEALKLRGLLIDALAHFDDQGVVERAGRLFDQDESGRIRLEPSIRASVIAAVGTHADRNQFDRLVARLKSAGSEEDLQMYALALAAGRDAERAREFLALSLAGVIAPNVASHIPGLIGEESPLGDMAYGFTLANWEPLAALAGTIGKTWLLPAAASRFNDLARAERLMADQRRTAGEDGTSPAARIADQIRLRAVVKRRDAASAEKQLRSWRPAE
jgi:aminopeptidase N